MAADGPAPRRRRTCTATPTSRSSATTCASAACSSSRSPTPVLRAAAPGGLGEGGAGRAAVRRVRRRAPRAPAPAAVRRGDDRRRARPDLRRPRRRRVGPVAGLRQPGQPPRAQPAPARSLDGPPRLLRGQQPGGVAQDRRGVERLGMPAAVAGVLPRARRGRLRPRAGRGGDICGAMVEADPSLRDDVLLGAAACPPRRALRDRARRALDRRPDPRPGSWPREDRDHARRRPRGPPCCEGGPDLVRGAAAVVDDDGGSSTPPPVPSWRSAAARSRPACLVRQHAQGDGEGGPR